MMNLKLRYFVVASVMILSFCVTAQRVETFSQVNHPHNYYYKELYLPQLTSGPSSLCWSPEGKFLIYSMEGSLWRQGIDAEIAFQITDGDGYDYQPDISPDGNYVIFSRYDGRSLELMLLDLRSDDVFQLTQNGGVNIEARWSPDGKEILFVSTFETGHFLVYKSSIAQNKLSDIECQTPDRESKVDRYYYSSWDHAISPFWTKDGKGMYYISNREVPHGSGDIVHSRFDKNSRIERIRKEETSWRARPDISPDYTRIVYAGYSGGNWHQLWLIPSEGGHPFPITYGDYDNTSPRWSPDGTTIAFISNRTGNTSIWFVDVFDGGQKPLIPKMRRYKKERRPVHFEIVDQEGDILSSRISVVDRQGKFYAPAQAWIHGDDSYYEGKQKFETHYFHCEGQVAVMLPEGQYEMVISHGQMHEIKKMQFEVSSVSPDSMTIVLDRLSIPSDIGTWWSGDLHIHMNYGGNYRSNPSTLVKAGEAEDLNFLYNLIVNKEQRIPDVNYFSTLPDTASTSSVILLHAQEYHTSFWGHLGFLNLENHLILPDYVGYPYTAVASIFPHNAFVSERAHRQNALVGYVHPFLDSQIFPQQSEELKNELPLDAALGMVDYYELVGFAHHRASEHVWYQLLNCGIHIPAGAGTDAMANYASLRGPVGLNRVYVKAEGEMSQKNFLDGLKGGKSFVTNGPIIDLKVNGAGPGDTITMISDQIEIDFKAIMRSASDVENLAIIWNGNIIKNLTISPDHRMSDATGKIKLEGPGWLLLRAWNKEADPDILDYYPYASTNPIYILPKGGIVKSESGGKYFLPWIDRIEKAAMNHTSYRSSTEKKIILDDILKARAFYQDCIDAATIK